MEVTWWWTGSGGYVIGPFRVVFCLKTEGLLLLFHCTRVNERTECGNYSGISLLRVAGILVDRVRRMTECLIEDE